MFITIGLVVLVLIILVVIGISSNMPPRFSSKEKSDLKNQLKNHRTGKVYKRQSTTSENRSRTVDNDFMTSDFPDAVSSNHSSNGFSGFGGGDFGGGGAGDSWGDSGSSDCGGDGGGGD